MTGETGPRGRGRGLRRTFIALLGALVFLIALVVLASVLATRVVEGVLSSTLGVPVQVGSADFEWLDRAVVLRDLELILPGAAPDRPLLRAASVRAQVVDLPALWGSGTLRLGELTVETADLVVESRDGSRSNLALLHDAIRARNTGGHELARGLRGIEIERAILRSVAIHVAVDGAAPALPASVSIESARIERIALPVPADPASSAPAAIALEGAHLQIGEPNPEIEVLAASVRFELAVGSGDAGIAFVAPELEAARVHAETVLDGAHGLRVDRLIALWHAAVAGLDLPELASFRLQNARLQGLDSLQRDRLGRELFRLTDGSLEAADLEIPEPAPPRASMSLRGHPFDDLASLELNARGGLLDASGSTPVAMTMLFSDVPLASIAELHLAAGRTTGSAEMTLSDGDVRGTATFRLYGVQASAEAPATMRAAYASYDALVQRNPPELTVPLSFRLDAPDMGLLFREVAIALARRLGGSIVDTAKQGVETAGDTARGTVEEIGRKARDGAAETGSRLQRSLKQLLP